MTSRLPRSPFIAHCASASCTGSNSGTWTFTTATSSTCGPSGVNISCCRCHRSPRMRFSAASRSGHVSARRRPNRRYSSPSAAHDSASGRWRNWFLVMPGKRASSGASPRTICATPLRRCMHCLARSHGTFSDSSITTPCRQPSATFTPCNPCERRCGPSMPKSRACSLSSFPIGPKFQGEAHRPCSVTPPCRRGLRPSLELGSEIDCVKCRFHAVLDGKQYAL